MASTDVFGAAIRDAEALRKIGDALAPFATEDRVRLLALAVAVHARVTPSEFSTLLGGAQASSPPARPERAKNGASASAKKPSPTKAPPRNVDPDSLTSRLTKLIRDAGEPRTIAQLTMALYGNEDTKNKDKLRSLLAILKKRGDVENTGQGVWRATTKR